MKSAFCFSARTSRVLAPVMAAALLTNLQMANADGLDSSPPEDEHSIEAPASAYRSALPLAVSVRGERHLLVFQSGASGSQPFEFLDINAESGTTRSIIGLPGRVSAENVVLHSDDHLYIAGSTGDLASYDFASRTLKPLGRPSISPVRVLRECSDGNILIGGESGSGLEMFDRGAATFTRLPDTEGIVLPNDLSQLDVVSGGQWLYIVAGPVANQLVIYDRAAGAIKNVFDSGEDVRVAVGQGADGVLYASVRADGEVTWLRLDSWALQAVEGVPVVHPMDARGRVVRDPGAAARLLGLSFSLQGPTEQGLLTIQHGAPEGPMTETAMSLQPEFLASSEISSKSAVRSAVGGGAYYVSPSGNNTNPGTAGAPFKTLKKAVSVLKPGDTLLVMPGTYTDALINIIPTGADAANQVIIRAADPNNRPIIKPHKGQVRVLQLEFYNNQPLHHVTIDGFVIDGANVSSDAIKLTSGAHHITIANSEVRNAPNNGIITSNNATQYNTFRNLDVHHNGYSFDGHGFYISSSNNIIDSSKAHDNSAWGIHVYSDGYAISNNTIHRSQAYDNGKVLTSRGVGIGLYSGSNHVACDNVTWGNPGGGIAVNYGAVNAKLYNNTVHKNGANGGIIVGQESSGTQVINNIVTQNSGPGISHYATASGTVITNNLVFGNAGSNIQDSSGRAVVSGTVTADPQYVSSESNNLRIRSTSPAIDKGVLLSSVTEDADGVRRPQGTIHDIGAYESTVTAPAPVPAPVDTTAPSISAVAVQAITASSAVISWTTNEASDTQVDYGTTTSYGMSTPLNSTAVTQHSAMLSNLAASTSYQFRVKSRDAAGNLATSVNMSFTTAPASTPPPPTGAGTYYVSPSGNDSNGGTQAAPFRTINKAVSVLKPGNTLLVMPGTYAESLYNVIPPGLDSTNQVTLRAADPNNRPIIKPNSGEARVLQLEFYNNQPLHHVTIDGFVIDGANVSSDAIKLTSGAHHITIANSEVRNAPNNGIITSNDATQYNTFRNLDVHHNGYSFDGHGLYISSSNNLIEGCKAHDNSAWGIHVYSGSYPIANVTVHRNQAYDNGRVLTSRGVGIGLYSGTNHVATDNVTWGNPGGGIAVNYGAVNAKVYNNTVYRNGANGGIIVGQESSGTQVINNIVTANSGPGIAHYATVSGTAITNNLVFGNAGSSIQDSTGRAVVSGTVTADPEYVDAASYNLRIRATSPAIDRGALLSSVTEDADGVRRPQGGTHDIGAYEVVR